jgi:hypothetical protein
MVSVPLPKMTEERMRSGTSSQERPCELMGETKKGSLIRNQIC